MTQLAGLPAGRAVFLYAAIAGASERWEREPELMRDAQSRYHQLLRDVTTSHGGVVYQVIGDLFVAVFVAPRAALDSALDAQRALLAEPWPEPISPLLVRLALHEGEGHYLDDGYHAEETLNRLFRLLSASYGGQILLTDAVYARLSSELPPGVSALDLGLHRLRDLTTRLQVWQLLAPDLPVDFPPLRSLSHHPNNLPGQATELFGRTDHIADVAARLRSSATRFLTLTGLGGVGKTRLGLAVAAELLPHFPDGVFFVALDQIQEPGQLASLIASTLGLREAAEQPLSSLLAHYLQPRRLLLVLDNCEHVLLGMPLLAELLSAAPQLKILATSRVPLGVYGEQEQPVPPLPLPVASSNLAALAQNAAVQLFVARAQAVMPDFQLSAANASTVATICAHLEGIPLALELAAARVRTLPLEQILAHLDDRLTFLTAQTLGWPKRQLTLRATLEWSYELLLPQERKLLTWLSIFVGGASLEALAAVWQPDAAQPLDLVDGLMTLIGHSLVQPQLDDDSPRYNLLDTVREYSREQLAARGELAEVTLRHGSYFQQFTAEYNAAKSLSNPAAKAAVMRDYPNLRAALRGAVERSDSEMALNISKNLVWFWESSGFFREGVDLLNATLALPLPGDAPSELQLLQAKTQGNAAILISLMGEHGQARRLLEAALSTARLLEDDLLMANTLSTLSSYFDPIHEYDQIRNALLESVVIFKRLGIWQREAVAYILLGDSETRRGWYQAAREYYALALKMFRANNDQTYLLYALHNLGTALLAEQAYDEAEVCLSEALTLSQEADNQSLLTAVLIGLGLLALCRSDPALARTHLRDALQRADSGGFVVHTIFVIGRIGWLAELEQLPSQATQLIAAFEVLAQSHELGQYAVGLYERKLIMDAGERARAAISEADFAKHHAIGQQLSLAEATAIAREVLEAQ